MMTMGEANEDLETIVKEIRLEMKEMHERLILTEENLLKTKEELKAKDVVMECAMRGQKDGHEELQREVSLLKNPPYFHVCA